mmetsp:Transcript_10421/g.25551  ORF Transcript_10421/g.25551 Transcript_10421/m.25551 type:complete len:190 (-) Transcript_10421:381-950(-)|eukprot:CAMPEP_0178999434 /NCGR_PEP_ID=MMETSP0795-20121207/10062_1 /TAXON_ID=88552 /ORGANISM="Amoebophrya sp., Strain Ameob2" /LENGTH=189 /DNA_ID=CAMNT_0020692215 /DNA_START=361 /DNA_END=930 /DNA_ORIENTATION=-
MMVPIAADYVLGLEGPSEDFLCGLDANVYGVEFLAFKIRSIDEDAGSSRTYFDIRADTAGAVRPVDDEGRQVHYHFGPEFLDLKMIGTELEFKCDQELHNFRMVEKHYFGDQCIKSYDFTMPFCMPNSTNTWEIIYTMPELTEEWKNAIITNPWQTRSDSYYFVNDTLIMHNKAFYNYSQSAETVPPEQ